MLPSPPSTERARAPVPGRLRDVPETNAPFTGAGVALLTLFDDDGGLDATATADLASRLVVAGVRAVVVAGTTGEAAALTLEERCRLLDAVRSSVGGNVPVLAGTGAPSDRQAVELTSAAVDHGADALLVLSPPGARDVRPYYDAVAAAAGVTPVLAYHYPAASSPGIPLSALAELPVAGLKDSTGDPARLCEELDILDGSGGHLYTGSSWVLSFAGPLGAAGAILALANVEPERCVAAFDGDAGAQRALTRANVRAHAGELKAMAAERWGTSPVSRVG